MNNEVRCQVSVAASGERVVVVRRDANGFTTGGSFTGFASDGNGTFHALFGACNATTDTDNNRVCGTTNHPSPFLIVEADNPVLPGPAPSCRSRAQTRMTIPVRIDRGDPARLRQRGAPGLAGRAAWHHGRRGRAEASLF